MSTEDNTGDYASTIYNSINLLTIRKSARFLCELETDIMEDFAKKYSGIMIFLLNILDQESSVHLLTRLTDSSIIYVIEEELRMLLIREVARVSTNLDLLVALSTYLEFIDRPHPENAVHESAREVLQLLYKSNHNRLKKHFSYLENLPQTHSNAIIEQMIQRNMHVAFGVMIFAPEKIMCEIIDSIARIRPQDLMHAPSEVLNWRFRHDYDFYTRNAVYSNLPDEISDSLKELARVRKEQSVLLERIEKIIKSEIPEIERRNAVLEVVFQILHRTNPSLHEILLLELKHKNLLREGDIRILNYVYKRN